MIIPNCPKNLYSKNLVNGKSKKLNIIIFTIPYQPAPKYQKNHYKKFEIGRTILTCLNQLKELYFSD